MIVRYRVWDIEGGAGQKKSMFFDEVVSKLIRFGLVSLLNPGPTYGAKKVLFRISLRPYEHHSLKLYSRC